jgi:carbon storage regulator CsrA
VPGLEEEIEVTVVQIDASRVRLGFKAPESVTILREELRKKANEAKPVAVT